MANNKIPSRGAKLLAASGQEANFLIYRDLSKTGDNRPATDFDRVVSNGTIASDNTGSPWLVVHGYKYNIKEATGYILINDGGTIWEDQPIESAQAPAVPGSVSVDLLPNGKGVLSWVSTGTASVEIEVAPTAEGPYKLVAIFNNKGGEYTINRPIEGKGLYYRLRSSNEYADSAYSRPVHIEADHESNSVPVVTSKVTAQRDAYAVTAETENLQTASLPMDEPIFGWMRSNIRIVLVIGASVIVALMMMVVARRS